MTLSAQCGRCVEQARDLGNRVHRQDVPEPIRAKTADTKSGIVGYIREQRRLQIRLHGAHGPADEGLRQSHRTVSARKRGSTLIIFEKGSAKTKSRMSTSKLSKGDEELLFVGKAQEKSTMYRTEKRTNPKTGQRLRLDREGHCIGQSVLPVLRRRRLRSVLHQVQLLLPLQRQAVLERPRVRQVQDAKEGIAFEDFGQRHPVLRRSGSAYNISVIGFVARQD